MDRRDVARKAGVFVAVFVLVTAVTALGSVPIGGENQTEPLTVESHQPGAILAETPEEAGAVNASADTPSKTVVIDQAHNNSVTADQIGPFVTALVEAGHDVRFYTDRTARNQTLDETLTEADAFVVVAPEDQYNESERERVVRFTEDGGRVLLVNEPARQTPNGSTPATPMTTLAGAFGLGFESGYLYDLQQYDTNYKAVYATPAESSPLTQEVERVTMATARPVVGGSAELTTRESTALSTTRRQSTYTVLAREDTVVALGDRSLLGPDYAYTADNEVLLGNLADFLVSGSR